MHIWFWAWLLLAGILAVMGWFDRDFTLPWAFGAAAAGLLEALGVAIVWQWATFVVIPSAAIVTVQRFRAPGRRSMKSERRGVRR